jgi:hypothetical protein
MSTRLKYSAVVSAARLTLVSAVAGGMLATSAYGQSAKDIVGPTPWETVENEPAPKLVLDAPLGEPLSRGALVIQYRTEHLRIVPEVGGAALNVSPRIGHLHVTIDNLPWHWADAGNSNTIIVVGLPAGQHSIRIELAGTDHHVYTGQTVTFTVPGSGETMH